ncbi:MAG: putative Co/Zn/Cd efflux system rane fusion protein [Myxococcaceae bacterium]|nr:putative Co/Zn/Cd efflux system rane fusion protein [Myxococcaceae bacterium]
MNKRSTAILLGLLALCACRGKQEAKPKPPPPREHVETAAAQKKPVPRELTLTGVLVANERTDLAANAAGRVVRVFVELGERVAKDAPIVQLDKRTAALAAREASANVQTAVEQLAASKKDCDRYQGLLAKGAITQQEYDRAMGQCQTQGSSEVAARVRVEQASQQLADSTVRAPFAGKIADRAVHVGDYVRPDSKVVTLLADDPLRLRLTVPEGDIFAIKPGLEVRFETSGTLDRSFRATVKFIGGEVREQTRDLVVEAIVDNHDGALLPGMFVIAHLSTGVSELPVVDKRALVAGASTPSVFIVDGDRVRQRVVQLGPPSGELLSILDGIKPGDRVVMNPSNKLSDGALVD